MANTKNKHHLLLDDISYIEYRNVVIAEADKLIDDMHHGPDEYEKCKDARRELYDSVIGGLGPSKIKFNTNELKKCMGHSIQNK